MFGLMRSCGCGTSPEAKRLRQLHYCATCKATGRLFGQRARLTLNHDAVFLGELLLALERIALPPRFTARRCFTLPVASEIPNPLAYAAAANVVLAEFALNDKLADHEGGRWKLAHRGLRTAFTQARAALRASGVPLEILFAQHDAQARAEARPTTLMALATPTGTATRLVFAHGHCAHAETLAVLGEAFGRLIYTLDALLDRADDLKNGAFNALAATGTTMAAARAYVRQQQKEIVRALVALPLTAPDRRRFTLQLHASVNHALMSMQEQPRRPRYQPPQQKACACSGWCQNAWDTCRCLNCCGECACDGTCNLCSSGCDAACCHGCHSCDGACCSGCGDCGCGACCCPSC